MSGHLGANLCAFTAGLRTFPAVFHVCMHFAFFRTTVTNICTQLAKLFCKLPVHAHYFCGSPADGGAFKVQLNTPCQCPDVLFLEAGHSAMVTDDRAVVTGIDTFLIMLMWHNKRFKDEQLVFTGYRAENIVPFMEQRERFSADGF